MIHQCHACWVPVSYEFAKRRQVNGVRKMFCIPCAEKVPKKTKGRGISLIGAGGRARKQPTKDQAKFTIGGHVIATQVSGYEGYDVRIQCSPAEVEELKTTGHYSKQWRQLTGK